MKKKQAREEYKTEEIAEAIPLANEELPEYPAFDKSATANDVTVHATAQEGVLSLGAHLVAK